MKRLIKISIVTLLSLCMFMQIVGCALFPQKDSKSIKSYYLNEENHLILVYNDDTVEDLGLTDLTKPEQQCPHTESTTIFSNVKLNVVEADKCTGTIKSCNICGNLSIEYKTHTDFRTYTIEATETTEGETGKECKTCGFRYDK